MVHVLLVIKQERISKITKVKRVGRVVQVVDHLPSKDKARFQTPYHRKKRKEKEEIMLR
jgi:hypothetical protein